MKVTKNTMFKNLYSDKPNVNYVSENKKTFYSPTRRSKMEFYVKFINLFCDNFPMSTFFSWLYENKKVSNDTKKCMFKLIYPEGTKIQSNIIALKNLYFQSKKDMHFLLFDQLSIREINIGVTVNNNQGETTNGNQFSNLFAEFFVIVEFFFTDLNDRFPNFQIKLDSECEENNEFHVVTKHIGRRIVSNSDPDDLEFRVSKKRKTDLRGKN